MTNGPPSELGLEGSGVRWTIQKKLAAGSTIWFIIGQAGTSSRSQWPGLKGKIDAKSVGGRRSFFWGVYRYVAWWRHS
jgi:hypothetical protein